MLVINFVMKTNLFKTIENAQKLNIVSKLQCNQFSLMKIVVLIEFISTYNTMTNLFIVWRNAMKLKYFV